MALDLQGTQGGEAIQFGAARDSQTAADTAQLSGHVSTGAATFAFIQAVERAGTNISYGRLLQACFRRLNTQYRCLGMLERYPFPAYQQAAGEAQSSWSTECPETLSFRRTIKRAGTNISYGCLVQACVLVSRLKLGCTASERPGDRGLHD